MKRISLCLGLLLVVMSGVVVRGQAGNWPEGVRLDWEAFLLDDRVMAPSITDPVWSLENRTGRRQVMIPFVVVGEGVDVDLRSPALAIRGAQFQAWWIPPAPVSAERPDAATGRGGMESMQFGDGGFGPAGARPAVSAGSVEVAYPRLAKGIEVKADGAVAWSMDRVITGAVKQNTSGGYGLKLDPGALRGMRPTPPARNRGGNVDRAAAREQIDAFRAQMDEFNALQKSIRALPDRFEERPVRVWGVYSLSDRTDELEMTGLETGDWSILLADYEALRAWASSNAGEGGEDPAVVGRMLARGNPLDLRLVALAAMNSGVLNQLEGADASVVVGLAPLLTVDDEPTRRVVVGAIAEAETIGPRAVSLLQRAVGDSSAEIRLLAATGLLRADPSDDRILPLLTQMLERGAVPASLVLERVAEYADRATERSDASLEAWNKLVADLPVTAAARRDGAVIGLVVSQSVTSGTMRQWLEQALLGSGDEGVTRQTLATLAAWPEGTERLVLSSPTHPLLAMLSGPDSRDAWLALSAFEPERPAGSSRRFTGGFGRNAEPEEEGVVSAYDAVLRAAVKADRVPEAARSFVYRSGDEAQQSKGLLVLAGGKGELAQALGEALLESALGSSGLRIVALEQRVGVIEGLYRSQDATVPALVPLVLAQPDAVTAWLGGELDQGELPGEMAWAEAIDRERDLLTAGADSRDAVALAGWLALSLRSGGDEELGERLYQEARSENVSDPASAVAFWEKWGIRINAERIGKLAGSYRLQVIVTEKDSDPVTASLGIVRLEESMGELSIEGGGLSVEPGERELELLLTNPVELGGLMPDGPSKLSDVEWPSRLRMRAESNGDGWTCTTTAGDTQLRVEMRSISE